MAAALEARKVGVGWFRHFVAAPFQKNRGVGGRVYIDVVEITVNVWQFHQTLVHESEPEPGEIGEHVHTKVPVGKPWQVFEMP